MRVHGTTLSASGTHGQFVAALVLSGRKSLAAGAVLRAMETRPRVVVDAGATGFGDLHLFAEGLVEHVAQALIVDRPSLY